MVTLGSDTTLSRVQDLWARVLEHIRGSIQPKQFDLDALATVSQSGSDACKLPPDQPMSQAQIHFY